MITYACNTQKDTFFVFLSVNNDCGFEPQSLNNKVTPT